MTLVKYKVVEEMHIRSLGPRLMGNDNIVGVLQPGFIIDVVNQVKGDFYKDTEIWLKDANGFYYWQGATVKVGEEASTDPDYSGSQRTSEWWFEHLQIRRIWNTLGIKGKDVRVTIWDTGVDANRAGLTKVDGYNFLDNDNDFNDTSDTLHGTQVARLIGSIAPECSIFVAKAYEKNGANVERFEFENFANSDIFKKTDIINISYAFQPTGSTLIALVDKMKAKIDFGHTVCAAIGNFFPDDMTPFTTYPSALPSAIAIGAINKDGSLFTMSPNTDYVSFCAPGSEITNLLPNSKDLEGTSFACAIVSGISALIISYFRKNGVLIDHSEIKNLLLRSCKRQPDAPSRFGNGILDTDLLLQNIQNKIQ